MSILDPLTCGLAKIVTWNVFTEKLSVLPTGKTKVDKNVFNGYSPNSSITHESFKGFKDIAPNIKRLGKRYPVKKHHLLATFGITSWDNSKQ